MAKPAIGPPPSGKEKFFAKSDRQAAINRIAKLVAAVLVPEGREIGEIGEVGVHCPSCRDGSVRGCLACGECNGTGVKKIAVTVNDLYPEAKKVFMEAAKNVSKLKMAVSTIDKIRRYCSTNPTKIVYSKVMQFTYDLIKALDR